MTVPSVRGPREMTGAPGSGPQDLFTGLKGDRDRRGEVRFFRGPSGDRGSRGGESGDDSRRGDSVKVLESFVPSRDRGKEGREDREVS